MSIDWDAIRAKVQALRDTYRLYEPPVNLYRLAPSEGFEIVYFEPTDSTDYISGVLDQTTKTIFLNINEPHARQNFTIAHEIAHYYLGHPADQYGASRRYNSRFNGEKPDIEREADYFATELLMPADQIEAIKAHYDIGDDAVALSRIFGVSVNAMQHRLKELRYGTKV